MKIGFVGLGIMGLPMAKNLIASGYDVTVYNRTQSKCDALAEQGAKVADTPGGVAVDAEVVMLCVSDTPDVDSVLFGAEGIVSAKGTVKTVIDTSTISPMQSESFAARLRDQGIEMLDAPVSGGQKGAEDGTLTIMVGGNEQAFAHCSALFDAIGKNVRYVGPNGSGLKAKMANQVMVGITLLATVEGIRILQRSGVNVDEALNLIGSGAAKSALLEKYAPKILAQDYAPGFRIKLMSKDLRLASELAVDLGMDLPGLDLVQEMFAGAEKEGLGDLGTQGLYKLFDN